MEHYGTYLYGRKTAKFDDFRVRSALTKDFRTWVYMYYKSYSPTNALSFETDFILGFPVPNGPCFVDHSLLRYCIPPIIFAFWLCTVSVNIQSLKHNKRILASNFIRVG